MLRMYHLSLRAAVLWILPLLPLLDEANAETTKIGVSVPLSGDAALYGTDTKNAIVFANEALAASRYELIIEDDKCNAKDAATIAHKLISVDRVRYVLGYPCSSALLAAAPILDRAGAVAISAMAMSSAISGVSPYVFRTCPHNAQMASTLARAVAAKRKRVGMISEEMEYPRSLAKEFRNRLQKAGVEVIEESYLPETVDFRPQLLKLRRTGIEALFVNPQAEPAFVRILQQMSELNWASAVYGNLYPSSPTFLKLAGRLAEGIVFSDLPFFKDAISEQGAVWYQDYLKRFGEPVSSELYFVTAVAAFMALDEAMQSGENVKDYLHSRGFSATMSHFSFDGNGDIVGVEPVLKVIKNARAVPFSSINPEKAEATP